MPADHAHHGEAHLMASATLTAASGDLQVQATISPARAGANVMEIVVTDRTGTTIAGREVTVALANRAAGVEPIRRSAVPTRAGTWLVTDLVLAPAGAWSVRIEVLVDDFRKPIFEAEIAIR
jgi:copper transport protein